MKCLVPNCDEPPRSRGLCHNHYKQALASVQRGQTTWERLEAAGFCFPANQRNSFAAWAFTQINLTEQPTK